MSLEMSNNAGAEEEIPSNGKPDSHHGVRSDGKGEDEDAAARGHTPAMPRQFSWLSALGLGFSITNSWVGYLVSHPADEQSTH